LLSAVGAGLVAGSLFIPWVAVGTRAYRPGTDALRPGLAAWMVTLGAVVLALVPTRLRVVFDGLSLVMGSLLLAAASGEYVFRYNHRRQERPTFWLL
jgi:hypothetical protein